MNRRDVVLAALATAGRDSYTPVQIQKLMFLIDDRLGSRLGGKKFDFYPHDYGPFDPSVYSEARELEASGLAEVEQIPGTSLRTYGASPEGESEGWKVLNSIPSDARDYIHELSTWVRSLSFPELVSAVYEAYPDMKVNSVFQDAK